MNEVVDVIERELVRAVRRQNGLARRRRKARIAVGAAVAALSIASAGIAALPQSPIDQLLSGHAPFSQAQGTPRIDLHLRDAGGLDWTMTTYRAKDGTLASVASPDREAARRPSAGGVNGFALATGLLDSPLASTGLEVVVANGQEHYLLNGTVDGHAREVTVSIGRKVQPAVLAKDAITVPVDTSGADLTDEGKREAARVPAQVSVRPFALTLAPDSLADVVRLHATLVILLEDGRSVEAQAEYCASVQCGIQIPNLG